MNKILNYDIDEMINKVHENYEFYYYAPEEIKNNYMFMNITINSFISKQDTVDIVIRPEETSKLLEEINKRAKKNYKVEFFIYVRNKECCYTVREVLEKPKSKIKFF